jgi:hypothetical protein
MAKAIKKATKKRRKHITGTLAAVEAKDTHKFAGGRLPRSWIKILRIANEMWPGGYDEVRNRDLIKKIGDATNEKPDVILRALGRRKG